MRGMELQISPSEIAIWLSPFVDGHLTSSKVSAIDCRDKLQTKGEVHEEVVGARDVAEVESVLPSSNHRRRQGRLDRWSHGSEGPGWQFARRRLREADAADLQEHRGDAAGGRGA